MDEKISKNEIIKANRDLKRRLSKSEFDLAYDAEHDILMVTIGVPQEAITEQIEDHVFCRLDPDTLKVVGFSITAFKRLFLKNEPEIAKNFLTLLERPRTLETWNVKPGQRNGSSISDVLGQLCPA